VNQAIKAMIIARGNLSDDKLDLIGACAAAWRASAAAARPAPPAARPPRS